MNTQKTLTVNHIFKIFSLSPSILYKKNVYRWIYVWINSECSVRMFPIVFRTTLYSHGAVTEVCKITSEFSLIRPNAHIIQRWCKTTSMNCQYCAPMYLHISQQYRSNMPAPLIIHQTHLLLFLFLSNITWFLSPRKSVTACCLTFGVNTPTSIGVPADMLGAGGSGVTALRGSHGGAGTSGTLVEGGRYTHTHNTATCQPGRSQTTAITVEHSWRRT